MAQTPADAEAPMDQWRIFYFDKGAANFRAHHFELVETLIIFYDTKGRQVFAAHASLVRSIRNLTKTSTTE